MLPSLPLRLRPGVDLREAPGGVPGRHGVEAAYVLSGIGSLRGASLRFAGAAEATRLEGDLEIVSLPATGYPALTVERSDAAGDGIAEIGAQRG